MKILFVLHQYLTRHVTGTEQYVRSLAHYLHEQGHDVHVFAYEPLIQFAAPGRDWFEQDEVFEDIPVHRCSVHPRHSANRELGEFENPLVGEIFSRWFEQQSFDVVHVFHLRNIGVEVLREPQRRGIPTVVHLMDFWFMCPNFLLLRRDGELCEGPPDKGFGCLECMDPELSWEVDRLELRPLLEGLADMRPPASGLDATVARRAQVLLSRKPTLFKALQSADAVIGPSHFLRGMFESQGFPQDKIRYLPYGLDPARGASRPDVAPEREDDLLHVGYIGSISEHKGIHVAIGAVRELGREDVRLHIHGDLESHPDYVTELRELAGDDSRIIFHGRFESAQLGTVLATVDCLVVPSLWYENTPFSMLEALNYGLPVLASDLGGMSEIVEHGSNGLLFPAGDAPSLAKLLVGLAADRDLLQQLAEGAKVADVRDDVKALTGIYEELVEAKSARQR